MLPLFRPLQRRLLLLVALAVLPVIAFGVLSLQRLNAEKRATVEQAMVETARAIAAAMDGELGRAISVVSAMSQSAALHEANHRRFYGIAGRVLANEPTWATISLADPAGHYIFNLRRPFGAQLPQSLSELESFEEVRRTARAVVTPLFVGRVSGEPLFSVRVPVFRDGKLRYVISAAVRPSAMAELIARQHIPAEGIVAISDQNGAIVARSRRQEEFLGKSITPDLRAAIGERGEGFASLMTLDGQRTYAAFSRSRHTGWAVAVGMPSEALDGPPRRSYYALTAGAVLALGLGVLGALALSRRIVRPISSLSQAAGAIGRGERPSITRSDIPEIEAMGQALAAAALTRAEAERVREEALSRERAARAEAEEASRRKDEFLAMLGHELRNPLGVVSNSVQVLLRLKDAPESARGLYRVLENQTVHLAKLIDDLLEASRVMAGKIELERAPLDLAAEVERVVATQKDAGRLSTHRVTLQTDRVWVDADRHRMEQIVSNLLDNAAKYTPAGKGIFVATRREGDEAVLEVRDEGIGMDADLRARVFELFVQGRRTLDRAQGGLGIGLTLVRRLVELHGGRISAESEGPDRGSSFTVRLPAVRPPRTAAAPALAPGVTAPRTVVIVEDSADARSTLRQLLELEGHRVVEANDGPQGVATVLGRRPDVALIDIGLPGFDGYECARRIRAELGGLSPRLIALTGYGLDSDRDRAREAGFDSHLTKPVSAERLAAELHAARA